MCDCSFRNHPGIDCGSDGCHCHDILDIEKETPVIDLQLLAKVMVVKYFNNHVDKTDNKELVIDDVYVVWWSKTLQNWKGLLSTTIPDGMYYELTHDGDYEVTYIDAYKKFDNTVVTD
jgi:hypothetical protein